MTMMNSDNSNKKLVSVIIPFFNMGEYLRDAIRSVQEQSYEKWEILLIDDGSTSIDISIAQQYAKQYPDRIIYLSHPNRENRGASASRNLGLEHARGEYIAFLDADDIWYPDKLSKQVQLMETHPEAGWIIGRVKYFSGNPENPIETHEQSFGTIYEGVWKGSTLLIEYVSNFGITPCPTATLIRKSILELIGGFETSFKMNFTDQVLFVKINSCTDAYIESDIVAHYRQHSNSSWEIGHKTGKYFDSSLAFWQWLLSYKLRFNGELQKKIEPVIEHGYYRALIDKKLYEHNGKLQTIRDLNANMKQTFNDYFWFFHKGIRRSILKDIFSIMI